MANIPPMNAYPKLTLQFAICILQSVFVSSCLCGYALAAAAKVQSPLTPEQALKTFDTEPGLRVELVAAEPMVVSPCACAFDERGRMYVAENRGYPLGPGPGNPPIGVVALLEDTDGDGRMDRRHEFATGLSFPNGVLPWKGGVIVTCAPDVLWLADTDGDGKADVREVWLTGFDDKNTTQLRVSHPTLGPDGWIYLTSGYTGPGKVRSPKFPERPAVELATDSRFNPFTGEFEAIDGRAQFGQTFDDFGRRFICYNRVQVQHVVLSSKHLRRNPHLTFTETVQNCPEEVVNDLLAVENFGARTYPISENITTADSHAGTFSAACGLHIYRGNALPSYYGRAFVCDPTGNLVHWDQLIPNGATFNARRSKEPVEFLRSPDNWFRPVNLATGPDGALYVCDLYRKTIEHPQYLPAEVRKRTDFDAGKGLGRIWRVTDARHSAKPAMRKFPDDIVRIIDELKDPNGWRRDTAFRLLIERQARKALREIGRRLPSSLGVFLAGDSDPNEFGSHVSDVAALHAYLALHEPKLVIGVRLYEAAYTSYPSARETAAKWLGHPDCPKDDFRKFALERLAKDTNPRVRFVAALLLGDEQPTTKLRLLARIAQLDGADRWTRAAILSGIAQQALSFLAELREDNQQTPPAELVLELGQLAGRGDARERLVNAVPDITKPQPGWNESLTIAFLGGLAQGLRSRSPTDAVMFRDCLGSFRDSGRLRQSLVNSSRSLLQENEAALAVRIAAVSVIGELAERPDDLFTCLTPARPVDLQWAAVRELCRLPGTAVARQLLHSDNLRHVSAGTRDAILSGLLAQQRHIDTVLTALESGELPPTALTVAQRNQLLKHKDEPIRRRASKLFEAASGDRMKVYEAAKACLSLKTDPARGRTLFAQHCASCHRLDRAGVAVGPDLLGARNQPKEAILLHVLVPNHEVLPVFSAYRVETTDGRLLSGLVTSETPASVTVRQAQGIEETIPRSSIEALTPTQLSLMPDGLEQTLKPQDLADLVAYLKGE